MKFYSLLKKRKKTQSNWLHYISARSSPQVIWAMGSYSILVDRARSCTLVTTVGSVSALDTRPPLQGTLSRGAVCGGARGEHWVCASARPHVISPFFLSFFLLSLWLVCYAQWFHATFRPVLGGLSIPAGCFRLNIRINHIL